jgi:hypothetical protein
MGLFNKKTKKNQTFKSVLEYLNNIDCINFGGCGISALAMYRWLKKHGKVNEDTGFYFFEEDEDNDNNNREYFTNKNVQLRASTHVVLVHNDKFIDSHGVLDEDELMSEYEYRIFEHSEEFLLAMINNVTSWNYRFDRLVNVQKIAKKLDIDLSDVKLSTY